MAILAQINIPDSLTTEDAETYISYGAMTD
jgi:hypothetical protein